MLPAVLEKLTFGVAAIVLYLQQRIAAQILAGGLVDLLLSTLFIAAWWRTVPRLLVRSKNSIAGTGGT